MSAILKAYEQFLYDKTQLGGEYGFNPIWMPDFLFPFQSSQVDWAVRRGRGALYNDCGLGKTPMQLVWAENVVRHTNKRVLIITPLAVSDQTISEGAKFGIECQRSKNGMLPSSKIVVTNYESLHHFNPSDFIGVVCDESSAIKNFNGARKKLVTEFMRKLEYRLLCTATAAPNDYIELGTSSEALGELGYMDMLNRFFKDDRGAGQNQRLYGEQVEWRFRRHGEKDFWRWVCSWSRACRKPSDLGFDNEGFNLPPLIERDVVVKSSRPMPGFLFEMPAVGLPEQREELRHTLRERCEAAAERVLAHKCSLIWCHLNPEGDLLEQLIPNAIQVKGSDSDEWKESAAAWFVGKKCICAEQVFRAKLASWQKDRMATTSGYIKSIVNSALEKRGNGSELTENTAKPTALLTTKQTKRNGRKTKRNDRSAIVGDGSDMLPIPLIDKSTSRPLKVNGKDTLTPGSSEFLPDTESHLSSTMNLPLKDVQSADRHPMQEISESTDSTLTTATRQENSEDFSARLVILDSASSEIIQSALKEPQCICGYQSGVRRLISKPVMFGWGLNFQHCNHITMFPSHSFEQYYQAVRRCWRFGQTEPVTVDLITTEGQRDVLLNLQRKAKAADVMFDALVANMNRSMQVARSDYQPPQMEIPSWLGS